MDTKNKLYITAAIICLAIAGWLLYPAIVGPGRQQPAATSAPPSPSGAAPQRTPQWADADYTPSLEQRSPVAGELEQTHIRVSVEGKVVFPGEYYMQQGETWGDAIQRAGGPLDGANTGKLNIDKPVYDGEFIEVP